MGKSPFVVWCILPVVSIAMAASCSRKQETRGNAPAAATQGPTARGWVGFDPYPHARYLCYECVLGFNGEHKSVAINWTSYATTDAAEKVVAFYSHASGGKIESEGKAATLRQSNGRNTLSVYPAAEPGYPSCENKPRPEERTVIIVSTRTGP